MRACSAFVPQGGPTCWQCGFPTDHHEALRVFDWQDASLGIFAERVVPATQEQISTEAWRRRFNVTAVPGPWDFS